MVGTPVTVMLVTALRFMQVEGVYTLLRPAQGA